MLTTKKLYYSQLFGKALLKLAIASMESTGFAIGEMVKEYNM
ncbi:hypothetical protein Vi05172_g6039 [Venturia inaequalis]|nr:hypothetical protein Vi05172_g6039 [Venturia inaequalis]